MTTGDWRTIFPSTGASRHMRQYVRQMLRLVHDGKPEAVIEHLHRGEWDRYDFNGVPTDVVASTREGFRRALSALRSDDKDGAKTELDEVYRLW